jgi:nucleotide-binding universal stress UspA family protein
VSWRPEVRYGDRAWESVRCAVEAAADLILLTAPRIDPADPGTGWGSLSYKIGVLAPCPVLLVKTPVPNLGRVPSRATGAV